MTAWSSTATTSYFNSRPCGRGDEEMEEGLRGYYISIHAPAGGATLGVYEASQVQYHISIHAPAGGATRGGPYVAV